MAVVVSQVIPHSPAAKNGIKPGETLLTLNGNPITDVLDYRFYMTERVLEIALLGHNKEKRTVRLRKGEYDDLGLEFETYLMDKQMYCKNKCVFCFVDQTPKGMRDTLYFKDDDSRLSFLFGNYITLTNLKEQDIDRIIKMKISPINISVHTTNPTLRVQMMKNPRAGEVLSYIGKLTAAGIKVNTQLVLCPGYNDKEELHRSLRDLCAMAPNLQSVAVVPVGLTRYRENLEPLRSFTKEEAQAVIHTIHEFSNKLLAQTGQRIAYPADEFFLKAQLPIPPYEYYGEFDQLENGVGLMALLRSEFLDALLDCKEDGFSLNTPRVVTIATGMAAYGLIHELAQAATEQIENLNVQVIPIENQFFGEEISVAGLITGQDLIRQLEGKELGEQLLIPAVMLRHEQDRFLDDLTLLDIEKKLSTTVRLVDNEGYMLLSAMCGRELF